MKSIKHRPFCLSKGLFACFTKIALNAFLCLTILYHVVRHYLLIIFACLIQTKCSNFCYLHLVFTLFLWLVFSYSTNQSQEEGHLSLPTLSRETTHTTPSLFLQWSCFALLEFYAILQVCYLKINGLLISSCMLQVLVTSI